MESLANQRTIKLIGIINKVACNIARQICLNIQNFDRRLAGKIKRAHIYVSNVSIIKRMKTDAAMLHIVCDTPLGGRDPCQM